MKAVALSGRVQQLSNGTLHFVRTLALDDGQYACKALFDTPKPPYIPERLSRIVTLQVKGKNFFKRYVNNIFDIECRFVTEYSRR